MKNCLGIPRIINHHPRPRKRTAWGYKQPFASKAPNIDQFCPYTSHPDQWMIEQIAVLGALLYYTQLWHKYWRSPWTRKRWSQWEDRCEQNYPAFRACRCHTHSKSGGMLLSNLLCSDQGWKTWSVRVGNGEKLNVWRVRIEKMKSRKWHADCIEKSVWVACNDSNTSFPHILRVGLQHSLSSNNGEFIPRLVVLCYFVPPYKYNAV